MYDSCTLKSMSFSTKTKTNTLSEHKPPVDSCSQTSGYHLNAVSHVQLCMQQSGLVCRTGCGGVNGVPPANELQP